MTMTLTQELAQALRELHDDIAGRFDMDSPSTNPGMKHAIANARAALARYDAEPADRYCQIVGMVCGNSPSCGESAVVWTKNGDMQCAECGHPMTQKTEPPTSRGSEGEVIGEVIRIPPDENAKGPFPKYVRWLKVPYCGMKLYAAPPPAQPSAEAWRQAIIQYGVPQYRADHIEAKARELSK